MEANLNDQSRVMNLLMDSITSRSTNNDIKTIHPGDLEDPEPKDAEKRGKIIKKLYKSFQPVACKLYTDDEYKGEHFHTHLVNYSHQTI